MADTKISNMPAASALSGAELVAGVQSGGNVKITTAQIATLVDATALTVGTTPIVSGTTTRILYDNAGVLGEYTLSGSGTVVAMATSPSFTTPTLGVAVATSINKVAFTAPASSATLTIIDGTTLTGPAASTTLAGLSIANVFTKLQTITQGTVNTGVLASTGYSLTGSDQTSMITLAGTLNTSGTPNVINMAIVTTAVNSSATFINITGGAAGTDARFSVRVDGLVQSAGGFGDGSGHTAFTTTGFFVGSGVGIGFSSTTNWYDTTDASISRISSGVIGIGTGAFGSVAGTLSCGVLKINAAPTGIGTGVKTISNAADGSTNFGHYAAINLNGTVYYFPCSSVAPT